MAIPNLGVSFSNTPDAQLFQFSTGIQHIAQTHRFKAWFLDQFGVLHDGKKPYPGAISTCMFMSWLVSFCCCIDPCCHSCGRGVLILEITSFATVEMLAQSGAKMVVISNCSKRASATSEKLKSLGFDPSLLLGVITGGELTHEYLERRDDPWFASLGRSCIHMTWNDPGAVSLDGLGLNVVDNIEDAEFILAHGSEAIGMPSGSAVPKKVEDLEKILEQCAARKIPMVVANPDYATVEATDFVMPGALGAKYEQLGGEVKWMGKPGKIIYEAAMAMAGVDPSECVAVGDSLHHDIKGANAAGVQSILTPGGIHATQLGLHHFGQLPEASKLRDLASKCDAYPTFVVPAFTL